MDDQNERRWPTFPTLCDALPEGVYWGGQLTAEIAAEIWNAGAAAQQTWLASSQAATPGRAEERPCQICYGTGFTYNKDAQIRCPSCQWRAEALPPTYYVKDIGGPYRIADPQPTLAANPQQIASSPSMQAGE